MSQIKLKTAFIALLILVVSCFNAGALGASNYVLDKDGKTHIPTPLTHQATEVFNYFGENGGMLNRPSDLFVSPNNDIYIADTGNSRIVKLDSNGNFVREFTDGGKLKEPEGVFVTESGDLFIADTQNQRVVHLNQDDKYIEEFVKPQSDMLEESMDFQVSRIAVSNQGYLYLIKGQHFMTIDAENEFKGYVGANELGFSLSRLLLRIFASKEQQEKQRKPEPPSYNAFTIGQDGMIYATTSSEKSSGQIKKINTVGENIYPNQVYGEKHLNLQSNTYNNPSLSDIAVDKNGIIYTLDQASSKIFTYDQEGNLLSVFGGSGKIKGRFEMPRAIDVNQKGELFVLDSSTGVVHKFENTDFMNKVVAAVTAYSSGEYESAYKNWTEVLKTDVNYPVANNGIGLSLLKDGKYDEAMAFFKLSENRTGYGKAFSEYRYLKFRENFLWVVLSGLAAIILLVFAVHFLRKKSDGIIKKYFNRSIDKE